MTIRQKTEQALKFQISEDVSNVVSCFLELLEVCLRLMLKGILMWNLLLQSGNITHFLSIECTINGLKTLHFLLTSGLLKICKYLKSLENPGKAILGRWRWAADGMSRQSSGKIAKLITTGSACWDGVLFFPLTLNGALPIDPWHDGLFFVFCVLLFPWISSAFRNYLVLLFSIVLLHVYLRSRDTNQRQEIFHQLMNFTL